MIMQEGVFHNVSLVSLNLFLTGYSRSLTVASGTTHPPHSNDIQVVPQSLQATGTIKIRVKTLAGPTQSHNVHGSDSIAKVCEEISNTIGVPACQIRLIYSGRDISASELTVAELGITDGSLLYMVLSYLLVSTGLYGYLR